jgi:asparagine synthase (glutamine-hydrolysing)
MTPRYLLLVAVAGGDTTALARRVSRDTGLKLAFGSRPVSALVDERCPALPIGNDGCVVGNLFRRFGKAGRLAALDASDVRATRATAGRYLLRDLWGGWVAAVTLEHGVRILRDPSATFPCYFTQGPWGLAFGSDAAILVDAGLVDIEIDWQALARHFLGAGMPSRTTCLRGIQELLPGFAIMAQAPQVQQPCWSPWDHVKRSGEVDAVRLAGTVARCVEAWAAGRGRLLLSVSGGLDSSIVAACLRRSGSDVVCLTLYGDDPSGDERIYARALCNHLGLPLIERRYALHDIDIAQPLGRELPRPTDRTQALAYERAHLAAAAEVDAEGFMTGSGGDSVFGYSQSAAPVVDRWLSGASWRALLATTADVCRQTGCSLADAAVQALRIAFGARAYRVRPNDLFLDCRLARKLAKAGFDHPWLDAPHGALPGKAAHIASILRIQQSFESTRGQFLPDFSPLMSQAIMEACLAVPSWDWRAGGRDRSLARKAFADDLPDRILGRRIKGGPGHFAGQILDHFRSTIRDRLVAGHLARHHIVDTVSLDTVLADPRPCSGEQRVRILELLAAEAWIDSWLARRAPAVDRITPFEAGLEELPPRGADPTP